MFISTYYRLGKFFHFDFAATLLLNEFYCPFLRPSKYFCEQAACPDLVMPHFFLLCTEHDWQLHKGVRWAAAEIYCTFQSYGFLGTFTCERQIAHMILVWTEKCSYWTWIMGLSVVWGEIWVFEYQSRWWPAHFHIMYWNKGICFRVLWCYVTYICKQLRLFQHTKMHQIVQITPFGMRPSF